MSWSKELVILSSYSLIYVNLKKLQNCCNFQVNCFSSCHLWTKKDVLSRRYSVPDAQLQVPWPLLKFFKCCILADTPAVVPRYRRRRVLEVWLWKLSVWARRSLWFVRILSGWLPCTQSKKKRFSHTERTQQVYLWYFFFQLLLVTRAKSLTTGTVSVSVFRLWQV